MTRHGTRQRLRIDGAMGEGGGQILRSALALSVCLGIPFHLTRVRAARRKPGLQPQHLAAVKAAAEISGATLVLQTVLPALLTAAGSSQLLLSGGTHNPLAPSFEFIALAFLPLIRRMGPRVTARLLQAGFYPAGGGSLQVDIEPVSRLQALHLPERGAVIEQRARAAVSHLPLHIAQRELHVIGAELGITGEHLEAQELTSARGPGNVVSVIIKSEHVSEVFTCFGERGVRAEVVATQAAAQVRRYLAAGVPVGEQLADQLLLPLALAGSGSYVTLRPSRHTTTNIAVLRMFMALQVDCEELGPDRWRIALR